MMVFKEGKEVLKDQLWFVGNLVQPLWKEIGLICPDLAFLEETIQVNLQKVKLAVQQMPWSDLFKLKDK